MKLRAILAAAGLAAAHILPASAAEPWTFSSLLSLTGPNAGYATELKLGMELAVEDINRHGGINGRPVALSMKDTQSNPGQVATMVRQACADSMFVIVTLSTEARVAFPVANGMQCPAIAANAAANGLTASSRPWTFSMLPPVEVMTPAAVDILAAKAKPKKAVAIIERTDPAAFDHGDLTSKALARNGVQVENFAVSSSDVDFGPVVTRALASNPDLIVVSAMERASLGLLKELRKSRPNTGIMLTSAAYTSLVGALPPTVLNGMYRSGLSDPQMSSDPRVKEFVKTYQARSNGRLATLTSTLGYDVVMVAKDTIEKAGIKGDPASRTEDRKKFIDTLSKTADWPGMTGKMSMAPLGYMVKEPIVLVHRSGKWELLNE